MPDKFIKFDEIFNTEPGLAGVRKIIKQSDVIVEFEKIFPKIASEIKPVKVKDKTLFLFIENSVLRNELKFRETEITEKINKYFKEERINKIKFVSKYS